MLLSFAGIAYYSYDRLTAWRLRTQSSAVKAEIACQGPSSSIVHLAWEASGACELMPGSRWVYLCIEGLSTVQWHPFSIMRTGNRTHVLVKGLGDWSSSLCDA